MRRASDPPTTKNAMAVKPYMRPIFLWSMVKTQLFHPVVAVGRRNAPSVWRGATTLPGGSSRFLGGCSMMANVSSLCFLLLQRRQIGDELGDLWFGQAEVRHAPVFSIGVLDGVHGYQRRRVPEPRRQHLGVETADRRSGGQALEVTGAAGPLEVVRGAGEGDAAHEVGEVRRGTRDQLLIGLGHDRLALGVGQAVDR